jgi:hypothetical protein
METGNYARGTMIPTLIEWAYSSRMKKYLPLESCNMFEFHGLHNLGVDLTYLNKRYRDKFIEPSFQKYCLAFTAEITPILKEWAIKNNMSGLDLILRFKSTYLYATQIRFTI